ncbi:MAG: histidine kinase [Bacteroidales bacterium]|jgi:LytS/YehU family sensor histidine kinase|nr:histidine kinase [Bacteroidales bacterium]
MSEDKKYYLLFSKSNWIAHVVYWCVASCLLFFVFSNRGYDYSLRLGLVAFIVFFSFIITYVINNFLIPKYLFKGKLLIFSYVMLFVFVAILWLVLYSSILIVVYNAYNQSNIMIPKKDDLIILVSGNYLIIILAAVIHFINESYRRLIDKKVLKEQKQITEIKLKEAQLKLLQGQIHPHFLFNMLNNLYGLVKESADESREVIVKLSHLLDYMLYECDQPKVSLKREVEFIKSYIDLERIRHDEHFNVNTSFPYLKDDILIAPLILFPFVENAFKHGFQDSGNSFINIQLSVDNNSLEFNVENSLNKQTEDKYLKLEGKGIGLKNIKERLELIYKDNYLLDVTSIDRKHLIRLKLTIENE